jgi:hypothetical protein
MVKLEGQFLNETQLQLLVRLICHCRHYHVTYKAMWPSCLRDTFSLFLLKFSSHWSEPSTVIWFGGHIVFCSHYAVFPVGSVIWYKFDDFLVFNYISSFYLRSSSLNCNYHNKFNYSRSQWPRGLKHKMSSSPQTLRLRVRIHPKVWLSLCFCSVFMLSCVGSDLATGSSPMQGVLPTICNIHNFIINSKWEQARQPNPSKKNNNNEKTDVHILLSSAYIIPHISLPYANTGLVKVCKY